MNASRPAREDPDRGAGHRLKLAREMTRVAADRVWREAGIPPRLLEMYERGAVPIRADHLATLAHCLDIPLSWLRDEGGHGGGEAALPTRATADAAP